MRFLLESLDLKQKFENKYIKDSVMSFSFQSNYKQKMDSKGSFAKT